MGQGSQRNIDGLSGSFRSVMSFKKILKYFLFWQVAIVVVVTIAGSVLPLRESDSYLGGSISKYKANPLLNFRSNYDGVHYALIATHGYSYGQQAFFPFYPKAISLFRGYIDDPILIGALISSISFLGGLYVLSKLILLDYSASVTRWTLLALLLFPTSFFFSAVYTEGLFLLLIVSSFYLLRTGRPGLACLVAAVATYTRLIGIFILPAFFIELLAQNRHLPLKQNIARLIPLIIIPFGLLLYMAYLDRTTGDPFAFYHLQPLFNQQRSVEIVLPYQVVWRYLKMITTVNVSDPLYLTIWLEFSIGIIFLGLSTISLFKQRLSYAVFNILAFILPTLTGVFTSLPRYVLICFPGFIILGQYLDRNPSKRKWIIGSFVLGFGLFLALFANGYWVA